MYLIYFCLLEHFANLGGKKFFRPIWIDFFQCVKQNMHLGSLIMLVSTYLSRTYILSDSLDHDSVFAVKNISKCETFVESLLKLIKTT